jgi:hypothetical protein
MEQIYWALQFYLLDLEMYKFIIECCINFGLM